MIGGFEDPSRGTVYLGGRDVTDLPSYKRDVNTVFQSYALFPHLDVFENVAFGLRRKKVRKNEVRSRVDEALRLVEMTGFETRKPGQMSGGQQQRVALARALVNRPKVLLLDEPLGALDLKLRKQMQLELKSIQQEVGITFIYVTHDQEEAMTMSDRLAVMRHGRIEQTGGPEEVYEHPSTPFVASFLGASNLLLGELKAQSNGYTSIVTEGGDCGPCRHRHDPAGPHGRRAGGGSSGEDHACPAGREPAHRPQSRLGRHTYVYVHRRELPVRGRGAGRPHAARVRAEPRRRGVTSERG